jgi:hypothetical protein
MKGLLRYKAARVISPRVLELSIVICKPARSDIIREAITQTTSIQPPKAYLLIAPKIRPPHKPIRALFRPQPLIPHTPIPDPACEITQLSTHKVPIRQSGE